MITELDIRTLIKGAAEAAGYGVITFSNGLDDDGYDDKLWSYTWRTVDGKLVNWNPHTNAGDALLLAITLDISLELNASIETDFYEGIGGEYSPGCEAWIVMRDATTIKAQEVYGTDKSAATYLAILRVAYEISKWMEAKGKPV